MSNISTAITIPWPTPQDIFYKKVIVIVQLVYGVPSILLMIFLFIFLGTSKRYSSSFYRIVQVDLLTNTICWLNTWISLRSAEFPFGTTYLIFLLEYIPWLWNISIILINFFFNMQFCSAAWMSVHRISAILFFNHYEKFWKRYYLLFAVIFVSYGFTPSIITATPSPQMNLINGTLYYTIDLPAILKFGFLVIILAIVYFLLLFGVAISVPIFATRKLQGVVSDNGVSKKLTKIALTYGFAYSGILLWTIMNAVQRALMIFPDAFVQISYSTLSVASDLMTLALPYILLVYDSNIRQDLRLLRGEAPSSIIISS